MREGRECERVRKWVRKCERGAKDGYNACVCVRERKDEKRERNDSSHPLSSDLL